MKIKIQDILIALRQSYPAEIQKYLRLKAETWCGSDKCQNCGTPVVLPEEIEIPATLEIINQIKKGLQDILMNYDSKDGYSEMHDEIVEHLHSRVDDIFIKIKP